MFETVRNILVEEIQVDANDVTMESELVNDLGINSLELADLIMVCEEKFGIEIGDDDIRKFITVADICEYLEKITG